LLYVPGVVLVLDHTDKIIRIAYHLAYATGLRFDFLFKPQIQHIMQEYIGKYRAEIPALGRPAFSQNE
jgi:hypothetical protein